MIIRVVDVETTGMEDPCEMVEIGWTDIRRSPDGSWSIDCGPYSEFVAPGMPISFPAMAVHHITEQDVTDGVSPDEARMIVDGAEIYSAHNAAFEQRFLGGDRRWICTFKSARTIWPNLQSHGNGAIRYERGLCLGHEKASPTHRAGPDTWITAHILLDLLKECSVEQLLDISGKPILLRKVDFGEHREKPWAEVPWDYLDWIVNKSKMPSDPKRVDTVHTAKCELARRHAALNHATAESPSSEQGDLLTETQTPATPAPSDEAAPKGGPRARKAAMLCQERGFWTFSETQSAEEATEWLRELCGVTSRALLDHDEKAAGEFDRIESRYQRWAAGYDD